MGLLKEHIEEKVCTLLFSSGLPETFWSEAVKSAEFSIDILLKI